MRQKVAVLYYLFSEMKSLCYWISGVLRSYSLFGASMYSYCVPLILCADIF